MKHKAKLDDMETMGEEHASLSDLLGAFPTTDPTVSQYFLKEMMLALRSSIQHSFTTALNTQRAAIDNLGGRVDHV